MLKRNGKFLAIGLATIGAVGAASVAFATWLVGVQQTEKEVQLKVLVDDTQDVNVRLTAKLAKDTLNVGETSIYDNKDGNAIIGTNDTLSFNDALSFEFQEMTLTVGTGVEKTFESITITCEELFALDTSAASDTNLIQVKDSKETELKAKRDKVEGLTYLGFSEITIPATSFEVNEADPDNKVYTLKTAEQSVTDLLKFTWGTYFDNVSPLNYYNNLYANKDAEGNKWTGLKTDIYTEDELATQHSNIIKELKAMKTYFEDKTYTLKVKANLK